MDHQVKPGGDDVMSAAWNEKKEESPFCPNAVIRAGARLTSGER